MVRDIYNHGSLTESAQKLFISPVLLLPSPDHAAETMSASKDTATMRSDLCYNVDTAELAGAKAAREAQVHGRPTTNAYRRIYARYERGMG